jgi:phosphatidylserine decarboxylase
VFAPGAGRWIGPPTGIAFVLVVVALLARPSGVLLGVDLIALAFALALAAFFAVFFRDPDRRPGTGIVSAADGRIRAVDVEGGRLRISVFMNVTDVHVNRLPLDATVEAVGDAGKGFRAAFRPDADRNVQRNYRLATALGPVDVIQMTGIVARRLVSFVREGSVVRKGDRLGMIVLGSRVDLLLPSDRVTATVRVGDRVRAGVTTVAKEHP